VQGQRPQRSWAPAKEAFSYTNLEVLAVTEQIILTIKGGVPGSDGWGGLPAVGKVEGSQLQRRRLKHVQSSADLTDKTGQAGYTDPTDTTGNTGRRG